MLPMLSVLFAFLMIPTAVLTAVVAMGFGKGRIAVGAPITRAILIGTFAPFAMIFFGLYKAWPWPWSQPETLRDGFGTDGSMFVVFGAPIWVGCLLVSYLILRPFTKRDGS